MLGRCFFTNLGDLSACFFFPHLCPCHTPTRHLPACHLTSPRKMRARRERRSLGETRSRRYRHRRVWARLRDGTEGVRDSAKTGNRVALPPGHSRRLHFVHVQPRSAPTRGAKRGRPAASPPHPIRKTRPARGRETLTPACTPKNWEKESHALLYSWPRLAPRGEWFSDPPALKLRQFRRKDR